jgi:7-cyano-7-deazaguanine synthase
VRSVVVLSGGQDSCTTLAIAARESEVVAAVHFEYGQRHHIEAECAAYFARKFGVRFQKVPLSALMLLGSSGLTNPAVDLSGSHPRAAHLPASFVPGRNLVFLTLAAALAYKLDAGAVYAGMCQTDEVGYPDCRRSTLDALQASLRLGMDFPELKLVTPLMNFNKAATFALAEQLGILEDVLEHTHTCYEGDRSRRHPWGYGCGECSACHQRALGWDTFCRVAA